jgi:hypothetical protein
MILGRAAEGRPRKSPLFDQQKCPPNGLTKQPHRALGCSKGVGGWEVVGGIQIVILGGGTSPHQIALSMLGGSCSEFLGWGPLEGGWVWGRGEAAVGGGGLMGGFITPYKQPAASS